MAVTNRGGNVVSTGATATWASTGNVLDGAPGSGPNTYATWTNSTNGASSTIVIGGYGFASNGSASISAVTAVVRHLENNTTRINRGDRHTSRQFQGDGPRRQ